MSFGYDECISILDNVNLEIYGNERLWLLGPNGTGKSTLVKLLVGELKEQSGSIKWGQNLNWVYFAQDQINEEIEDQVQEYFYKMTNIEWYKAVCVLDKFLFDQELRNQQVKKLSPGQKARLTFAIFMQNNYECLILDEPTNHLDIQTKEAIEIALQEYKGAVILVSHDRYFAEQLEPDRVLTIKDKRLVDKV